MSSTNSAVTQSRRPRTTTGLTAAIAAIAVFISGCASSASTSSGTTATGSSTKPEVTLTADGRLANEALLVPGDLGGSWILPSPRGEYPNSAELARTVPSCAAFTELVFNGGSDHGDGAGTLLINPSNQTILFSYVVVFPTVHEARTMIDAVSTPEFDVCWGDFNVAAEKASVEGVTDASFASQTPPSLTIDADAYTVKSLVGYDVIGGSKVASTCICVFAQVGRSVVEVHSPAEVFEPVERSRVAQLALDKVRAVLAEANGSATPDTADTVAPAPAVDGAAGAGDELFPNAGNAGYDVQSYDIGLRWDPTSGSIEETAEIKAVATQSLSQFNLDLTALEVTSVQVDGNVAPYSRTDRELVIDPVNDVADGVTFTTVIQLNGVPAFLKGSGGWFRDQHGGVIVMGAPEGPTGWFPVNDHPSDKAIYTLKVTAPNGMTVASNGKMTGKVVDGAETTWTYSNTHPQASYLTTLAIGNYQIVDGGTSASGVPIRNVFPTDRVDELTATFAKQPQMIDEFEKWFGPYPFEVYGALVADGFEIPAALETQTMSVFGSHIVGDVANHGAGVIEHELAHQWFGDSVSLEQWKDIWLNEGFATYAESLWAESQQPNADVTTMLRETLAGLPPQIAAQLDIPITGVSGEPDGLFIPSVYLRGSLLLQALRLKIGDQDFRTLLHQWTATYLDSNANTGDFIALAETVSGKQLDELFDPWLNSPALPDDFGSVPPGAG